jgi:hypothetical protein
VRNENSKENVRTSHRLATAHLDARYERENKENGCDGKTCELGIRGSAERDARAREPNPSVLGTILGPSPFGQKEQNEGKGAKRSHKSVIGDVRRDHKFPGQQCNKKATRERRLFAQSNDRGRGVGEQNRSQAQEDGQ